MTDSNESIQQAAALIVHDGRVCLVTASSGRRWILPKGTLERGQSACECAVIFFTPKHGRESTPASVP